MAAGTLLVLFPLLGATVTLAFAVTLVSILAVLAFLFPRVTQAVLVWTLGLAAIAGGLWTLVLSLRMRRAAREPGDR